MERSLAKMGEAMSKMLVIEQWGAIGNLICTWFKPDTTGHEYLISYRSVIYNQRGSLVLINDLIFDLLLELWFCHII